jgi:hypothetical protein
MSIQINIDQKLSPEDRDYLLSRGRRHLVLQNDRRFAGLADAAPAPQGPTDEGDEEIDFEAEVNELTADELRDELGRRGLATTGNKDALRKRLIEAGPDESTP